MPGWEGKLLCKIRFYEVSNCVKLLWKTKKYFIILFHYFVSIEKCTAKLSLYPLYNQSRQHTHTPRTYQQSGGAFDLICALTIAKPQHQIFNVTLMNSVNCIKLIVYLWQERHWTWLHEGCQSRYLINSLNAMANKQNYKLIQCHLVLPNTWISIHLIHFKQKLW